MSDNEVTTIPKIIRVFYDTYANLPVTGVKTGELGYATDYKTLYRWSGAAWQTVSISPVINFQVSAIPRNTNAAEKTTNDINYHKIKEIILNEDLSAVSVYFSLKGDGVQNSNGKIYKNGVAVGSQYVNGTNNYIIYSDDLTGFVAGDKLQIYARIPSVGNCWVKDFNLCYTRRIYAVGADTLQSALDTTTVISTTNNDP